MRNKFINYLINEKDDLCADIEEMIFYNFTDDSKYKPLSIEELKELENKRQQIYDIYEIIDVLNERNDLK